MTAAVGFCFRHDKLSKAVEIMRGFDCGIVPVVSSEMKVVGMVSDRDICLFLAERAAEIGKIEVNDLLKGEVAVCEVGEMIECVLKKMRKNRVKRLPVTSQDGKLTGIISIADILAGEKNKSLDKKILKTIKAISQPRPILLHEIG